MVVLVVHGRLRSEGLPLSNRVVAVQTDERLAEALVALLSHDLRTPLAPLALALSAIGDDPSSVDEVRELAEIASAQTERIGRLLTSVVVAVRGARAPVLEPVHLGAIAAAAAEGYESLGGRCVTHIEDAIVDADRVLLLGALLSLIECAGGDGGTAEVDVIPTPSGARVVIGGSDFDGCTRALLARLPRDWRSALALAARETIHAHGGVVAHDGGRIVVELQGAPA